MVMQKLINRIVDNLEPCERIFKTPVPFAYTAYTIDLKELLLLMLFGIETTGL